VALRRIVMTVAAVRFGEADLTTCDREPIHLPGSIQPHGMLLVIDRQTMTVEQVAGDSLRFLGLAPAALLGADVINRLDPAAAAFVRDTLLASTPNVRPTLCFGVTARGGASMLNLTLHAQDRTALLEFEDALVVSPAPVSPLIQLKGLVAAVQHSVGLEDCLAVAATAIRQMTGFDRAMVYRFLPDGAGVVSAEDVKEGLESFLGLHYPASDIPRQARELYRRNWLRAIATVDYDPAPLLPALNPRTGGDIDMSHCDLRSVSPIHLEYLRNMGVCASLSVSIIFNDRLWGLLVLHHYAPRIVPTEVRVACETFGQILSLQIESKVQASDALLREDARVIRDALVARCSQADDFAGSIASPELLELVNATGAAVILDESIRTVGATPTATQLVSLVDGLNHINQALFQTDHAAVCFPDSSAYATTASGILAITLSRAAREYVVWFRPESRATVRWGGDPAKPINVGGHGVRLTPRGSFAEWLESTRLRAFAWSDIELETAEALRVSLLEVMLQRMDRARRERLLEDSIAQAREFESRVEQRTLQLKALAADLEAVEDRERRNLARDLHDDLGQTLAAAKIRLAGLLNHADVDVQVTASGVTRLLDLSENAIRSLAAQLTPDVLHEIGLSAALDWLADEMEEVFGLTVDIVDDDRPKPLAQDARSIIYRCARELLINVAKHARARIARVEARCNGTQVIISVADDGVGYDVALVTAAPRRGYGLVSIRDRLALIGGTIELTSAPGAGTIAILSAPLASTEEPDREE
jgi:light-regulated signal transduction histidine kinase (bacteriophytochrome)